MPCRLLLFLLVVGLAQAASPLVLQTDFGTKDGAVAAMRGVAVSVSPHVRLFDLSHENTPFHIWEAAYRLKQAAPYWPSGTVFVSVIDPGVGTERASIVLETRSGHYFVSPDNGSLTLVAEELGIAGVREISAARHRRPGSEQSATFHGRDLYVVVGAKLAGGLIDFAAVGPERPPRVQMLAYERPRREGQALVGTLPFLDFQFGNVWTNLEAALFDELSPRRGERFRITIRHADRTVYTGEVPYVETFGHVPAGQPLLYLNSLLHLALAINQGNFARDHAIGYGPEWSIRVERGKP